MICKDCGTVFEYMTTCPKCGAPACIHPTKKHALLGFRSNSKIKNIISVVYLIYVGLMFLSVVFSSPQGKITEHDFQISRISDMIMCVIMISPYIFLSNTKFRSKLPLFKKNKAVLSIIGMCIVIIPIFLFGSYVESLHSEEYIADSQNHAYVEISRTEATTEKNGEILYRCDYCALEKSEKIERLPKPITPDNSESKNETSEPSHDISDNTENAPAPVTPIIIVTAEQLYNENLNDRETATEKYFEKKLRITGTVLSINDYGDLKGYYLLGGTGAGVVCWVEKSAIAIRPGQVVEFEGMASVLDSKHIEINQCNVLNAKWPENKPISPISISEWTWTKDYLGGVEWNFKLTNNTDKVIKYITLEWDCYNAVGDLVYDEIDRKPTVTIKYTGPLNARETTDLLRNSTLFYNSSYNSSKLTKLTVEFMDKTIIYVTNEGYSDILVEK